MSSYKNRLIGYFVLGWALALAVPPWFVPDSKKEFQTLPRVFLAALALNGSALAPACGENITGLSAPVLQNYPDLEAALQKLAGVGRPGVRVRLNSPDPQALARELGQGEASRICFGLEGETYLLECRPKGSIFSSGLVRVGTSTRGAFAEQSLSAAELEKFPYLNDYLTGLNGRAERRDRRRKEMAELSRKLGDRKKATPPRNLEEAAEAFEEVELRRRLRTRQLEGLEDRVGAKPFYEEVLSPYPLEEWRPLLERLGATSGSITVGTSRYLVGISVREYSEYVVTRLSLLSLARKIGGGALILLGLWLLHGSYGRVPGIRINPAWAAVFADTMFVLGMGVLSAGPLDYILENWFGLLPFLEDALQFTFAVMYLPCLFFLSWMAANMAGQSLEAGPKGVTWHGPGPSRFMPWESITGLDLRSSYVVVRRVGFFMPRRLQTKLVFRLGGEDVQELFEPGTRARKKAVLTALAESAPERLAPDLSRITEEWL